MLLYGLNLKKQYWLEYLAVFLKRAIVLFKVQFFSDEQ